MRELHDQVSDELGGLALTVSRLNVLRDICEGAVPNVRYAECWFQHFNTILIDELDMLNSIGKRIAELVPGATYTAVE